MCYKVLIKKNIASFLTILKVVLYKVKINTFLKNFVDIDRAVLH